MPAALADVSVGYFIVSHPATGAQLEMEAVTGSRPILHRLPLYTAVAHACQTPPAKLCGCGYVQRSPWVTT